MKPNKQYVKCYKQRKGHLKRTKNLSKIEETLEWARDYLGYDVIAQQIVIKVCLDRLEEILKDEDAKASKAKKKVKIEILKPNKQYAEYKKIFRLRIPEDSGGKEMEIALPIKTLPEGTDCILIELQ